MFCKNCGAELVEGALFCSNCGTKNEVPVDANNKVESNQDDNDEKVEVVVNAEEKESTKESSENQAVIPVNTTVATTPNTGDSYFDGTVLGRLGWQLAGYLLTVVTLGLGAPIAAYWLTKWETEHTVINGKRLVFTSTGGQFYWLIIKSSLLTIITFGLYYIFLPVKIERFLASHTYKSGEGTSGSYFDGGFWKYLGLYLLTELLSIVTLGICSPWAICKFLRWKNSHTVYNNKRIIFTGSAWGLFGTWLLCLFLTIITFGIYGFWAVIKVRKWVVSHTFEEGTATVENVKIHFTTKKVLIISGLVAAVVLAFSLIVIGVISIVNSNNNRYYSNYYSKPKNNNIFTSCNHSNYSFIYSASSYMTETLQSGTHYYTPDNLRLVGGEPWIPKGRAIGSFFVLKGDWDPHLKKIALYNGFQNEEHPDYYGKNSRLKTVKITVKENNYKSQIYDIEDTKYQVIDISELMPKKNIGTVTIEFEVLNVYPGWKYKDLAIDAVRPYF